MMRNIVAWGGGIGLCTFAYFSNESGGTVGQYAAIALLAAAVTWLWVFGKRNHS